MLGLNVEKILHDEAEKLTGKLKAIDLNHNHVSDVEEAKELISDGVRTLHAVEKKVSPAEIAAALNLLFPGKFSEAEVVAAEAGFEKLLAGVTLLQKVAEQNGLKI